jgi:hypothetical protein
MENRYITLHQLNNDRAEFTAFMNAIEKLGYKQGSDYFKNHSGNPSAMFKSSVTNDEKVKKLRTKHKMTSFGLESVSATEYAKFANYDINDKVKLFVEGKETTGIITDILFGDSCYKIRLENNQIVKRGLHEVFEPTKQVKKNNTLNESLELLTNKRSTRVKEIYKELFENELSIEDKLEEALNEHHLYTREEQEEFILANSTDYTSQDLEQYDDEEINKIYFDIESSLDIDNDLESEQEAKSTLIKSKIKDDNNLDTKYENNQPEKFDPAYDFFGDTELNESDFDVLNDDELEEIACENNIEYHNRKQAIKELLERGRFCKEDILKYKETKHKQESYIVDSIVNEALKTDWNFPAEIDYRDIDSRLVLGSATEQYAILDNMDTETWDRYLNQLASYGVTVEYDSVSDEFVVYRTEEDKEDIEELGERYEVEESDKQTITNIVESKGAKVIEIRGMLKESNKSNILEIIIEKNNFQTKIIYDDNAIIKPWSWNGKSFNFLQEAIENIYVPLKQVLKESIEQEKRIIKEKEKEITTLLERKQFANKTDKLPLTEAELRKQRSLEIMNKILDKEMLNRKFDR